MKTNIPIIAAIVVLGAGIGRLSGETIFQKEVAGGLQIVVVQTLTKSTGTVRIFGEGQDGEAGQSPTVPMVQSDYEVLAVNSSGVRQRLLTKTYLKLEGLSSGFASDSHRELQVYDVALVDDTLLVLGASEQRGFCSVWREVGGNRWRLVRSYDLGPAVLPFAEGRIVVAGNNRIEGIVAGPEGAVKEWPWIAGELTGTVSMEPGADSVATEVSSEPEVKAIGPGLVPQPKLDRADMELAELPPGDTRQSSPESSSASRWAFVALGAAGVAAIFACVILRRRWGTRHR